MPEEFTMKTATRLLTGAVAASLLLLASAAGADPIEQTGVFEVEGNAVDEATLGDDWNQIFCADPDTIKTGHCDGVGAPSASRLLSTFITDKYNDGTDDQFPGNNKDVLGTVQLGPGNVDDKNDIEHAYAALYRKVEGEEVEIYLYFGLDLLADNGDAAIGFWFTQNSKATVIGGPWQRKPGDVLVQADLLNGGRTAHVDVYTWGPNAADGPPVGNSNLYLFMHGAVCNLLEGGTYYACAITNSTSQTAPWDYAYKGEPSSTTFPHDTFFEGGMELSLLFGERIPCLSTFIAETRQSQSETSELADAAVGEFDVCSIDVKKEAQELSKVGDTANYTVTIENTGIVRLYKQSITDSRYGSLSSYCGAYLDPGQKCTISYQHVVGSGDPDPLTNTVTAIYDDAENLQGAEVTDTYGWEVNLFQPSIDLTKSGTPATVKEYSNVAYTLTLTNKSSADTPKLVGCTIKDVVLGVNEAPFELTNAATKVVNKSYAWMAIETNPNCVKNGDNYRCTNTASASCGVDGFPNTLNDSAAFTVTVIPAKPLFRVVKTGDAYSKVGDTVAYRMTIYNDSPDFPLSITSVIDTKAGNLTAAVIAKCGTTLTVADGTDASGTDQCSYDYTYTVPASPAPTDPLSNKVTVIGQVVGGATATKDSTWSVDLLHPAVDIAKSCVPTTPVEPDTWLSFEIDTTNTGDADLLVNISDTLLGINQTNVSLPKKAGSCEYGNASDTADGCYRIEKSYQIGTENVTNTAYVTAYLDPKYGDLKLGGLPNKYEDSASSTCRVQLVGDATRTWGFWKTHGSDGERFSSPYPRYGYTGYIAAQILPIDLGWITLDSIEDVFGLFWEKKAHCDKLTMTRLQASYQFLAALLNDQAFNTDIPNACAKGKYAGKTNSELFAMMRTTLAARDLKAIRDMMSVFSCYNEAGDDFAIEDVVPVPPADPNGTRGIAHDVVTTCQ
jgi:hypothetical protein